MTILHGLRLAARRVGLDITRFPEGSPGYRRVRLLQHFDVETVYDVGANQGQFASELRALGYEGRIVSFEPLSTAAAVLEKRSRKDERWDVVRTAIGDHSGTIPLNVAANEVSSSVLPMLETHVEAAPGSRYVSVEQVPIARLDDVADPFVRSDSRAFLKVDAQGYTRQVLRGAERTLAEAAGVQAEMSLVPLYAEDVTFVEGITMLTDMGFCLMGLEPGFTDQRTGQLLQVDAVFFRS
jgi:FkbM family methyltransferase